MKSRHWHRPHTKRTLAAILVLVVAALSGCGTLNDGGGVRGDDSAFVPSVAVLKRTAWRAMTDTRTWAPALGAAVFGATNWDRRVSDWAMEQNPLFGSQEAATNSSDDLRDLSTIGAVVTALAIVASPATAPSEGMERIVVQTGAYYAARGATGGLKAAIGRERPDGSNDRSFPSGHTTVAFADATLAQRNIDTLNLSPLAGSSLRLGFDAAAVGTAWARVEAGAHYPSDVLAGAAVGHFMAAFVNDAFLGTIGGDRVQLGFLPSRHGSRLEFSLAY